MNRVTEDAQVLFETTAEMAEEKASQAKGQLNSALKKAKGTYADFQEREMNNLRALDDTFHRHFYETLSLTAAFSLLIGFLLARRS